MLITLLVALGIPLGLVVYLLIQIIRDPNKIDQYRALLFAPLYKIGKWSAKTYIGAQIAYQVTEFFNRHIIRNIANQNEIKVNINWVVSEEDSILKENNTVIICIKKDKDQTKNILKAAELAIPIITYKYLRANIDKHIEQSIDLTTLRTFANKLGNHGKYAFKKYFLQNKINEDERISDCFQKLVQIDNRGYFIPIFLNELEYISDGIYANGDIANHTNEIIEFIEYLISVASVRVGDEVKQWSYFSKVFSAGIMLLANNEKMVTMGVKPYIDRITINLRQGHESIYIIAEENSWQFLERYEKVLAENDRVLIKGGYKVEGYLQNNPSNKSTVKIILLRKIDVVADDVFKEKLIASDIKIGKKVEGEVVDVSDKIAIVSVLGLDAFLKRDEISWYNTDCCRDVLVVGEKRQFLIKNLDLNKLSIELSLRFNETEPWNILPRSTVGEIVIVKISSKNHLNFFALDNRDHEIIIPMCEISWFGITAPEKDDLIGKEIRVKIVQIDQERKLIIGSKRQLDEDPWPRLSKEFRPGTTFIGSVIEVSDSFIRLNIKDGISGIIPKERMLEAGGIFSDHKKNIIVGQGLEVVITRVFVGRRKIHLNIKK